MAFTIKGIIDLKGILFLMLLIVSSQETNIDCSGKAFHCVNSTHFMICVDLGRGVSTTIDDFVIPCPLTTVCDPTNSFECEFYTTSTAPPEVSTIAATERLSDVIFNPEATTSIPFEEYFNTLSISTLSQNDLHLQSYTTDSILSVAPAIVLDIKNSSKPSTTNKEDAAQSISVNVSTGITTDLKVNSTSSIRPSDSNSTNAEHSVNLNGNLISNKATTGTTIQEVTTIANILHTQVTDLPIIDAQPNTGNVTSTDFKTATTEQSIISEGLLTKYFRESYVNASTTEIVPGTYTKVDLPLSTTIKNITSDTSNNITDNRADNEQIIPYEATSSNSEVNIQKLSAQYDTLDSHVTIPSLSEQTISNGIIDNLQTTLASNIDMTEAITAAVQNSTYYQEPYRNPTTTVYTSSYYNPTLLALELITTEPSTRVKEIVNASKPKMETIKVTITNSTEASITTESKINISSDSTSNSDTNHNNVKSNTSNILYETTVAISPESINNVQVTVTEASILGIRNSNVQNTSANIDINPLPLNFAHEFSRNQTSETALNAADNNLELITDPKTTRHGLELATENMIKTQQIDVEDIGYNLNNSMGNTIDINITYEKVISSHSEHNKTSTPTMLNMDFESSTIITPGSEQTSKLSPYTPPTLELSTIIKDFVDNTKVVAIDVTDDSLFKKNDQNLSVALSTSPTSLSTTIITNERSTIDTTTQMNDNISSLQSDPINDRFTYDSMHQYFNNSSSSTAPANVLNSTKHQTQTISSTGARTAATNNSHADSLSLLHNHTEQEDLSNQHKLNGTERESNIEYLPTATVASVDEIITISTTDSQLANKHVTFTSSMQELSTTVKTTTDNTKVLATNVNKDLFKPSSQIENIQSVSAFATSLPLPSAAIDPTDRFDTTTETTNIPARAVLTDATSNSHADSFSLLKNHTEEMDSSNQHNILNDIERQTNIYLPTATVASVDINSEIMANTTDTFALHVKVVSSLYEDKTSIPTDTLKTTSTISTTDSHLTNKYKTFTPSMFDLTTTMKPPTHNTEASVPIVNENTFKPSSQIENVQSVPVASFTSLLLPSVASGTIDISTIDTTTQITNNRNTSTIRDSVFNSTNKETGTATLPSMAVLASATNNTHADSLSPLKNHIENVILSNQIELIDAERDIITVSPPTATADTNLNRMSTDPGDTIMTNNPINTASTNVKTSKDYLIYSEDFSNPKTDKNGTDKISTMTNSPLYVTQLDTVLHEFTVTAEPNETLLAKNIEISSSVYTISFNTSTSNSTDIKATIPHPESFSHTTSSFYLQSTLSNVSFTTPEFLSEVNTEPTTSFNNILVTVPNKLITQSIAEASLTSSTVTKKEENTLNVSEYVKERSYYLNETATRATESILSNLDTSTSEALVLATRPLLTLEKTVENGEGSTTQNPMKMFKLHIMDIVETTTKPSTVVDYKSSGKTGELKKNQSEISVRTPNPHNESIKSQSHTLPDNVQRYPDSTTHVGNLSKSVTVVEHNITKENTTRSTLGQSVNTKRNNTYTSTNRIDDPVTEGQTTVVYDLLKNNITKDSTSTVTKQNISSTITINYTNTLEHPSDKTFNASLLIVEKLSTKSPTMVSILNSTLTDNSIDRSLPLVSVTGRNLVNKTNTIENSSYSPNNVHFSAAPELTGDVITVTKSSNTSNVSNQEPLTVTSKSNGKMNDIRLDKDFNLPSESHKTANSGIIHINMNNIPATGYPETLLEENKVKSVSNSSSTTSNKQDDLHIDLNIQSLPSIDKHFVTSAFINNDMTITESLYNILDERKRSQQVLNETPKNIKSNDLTTLNLLSNKEDKMTEVTTSNYNFNEEPRGIFAISTQSSTKTVDFVINHKPTSTVIIDLAKTDTVMNHVNPNIGNNFVARSVQNKLHVTADNAEQIFEKTSKTDIQSNNKSNNMYLRGNTVVKSSNGDEKRTTEQSPLENTLVTSPVIDSLSSTAINPSVKIESNTLTVKRDKGAFGDSGRFDVSNMVKSHSSNSIKSNTFANQIPLNEREVTVSATHSSTTIASSDANYKTYEDIFRTTTTGTGLVTNLLRQKETITTEGSPVFTNSMNTGTNFKVVASPKSSAELRIKTLNAQSNTDINSRKRERGVTIIPEIVTTPLHITRQVNSHIKTSITSPHLAVATDITAGADIDDNSLKSSIVNEFIFEEKSKDKNKKAVHNESEVYVKPEENETRIESTPIRDKKNVQNGMSTRESILVVSENNNYKSIINIVENIDIVSATLNTDDDTKTPGSKLKKDAPTQEWTQNSTSLTSYSNRSNIELKDQNKRTVDAHNITVISNDQNSTSRYTSHTKSTAAGDTQTNGFPAFDSTASKPKSNNFTCKQKIRGKYADELDCRKFYICLGNTHVIEGTCPDNTVFSDIRKQCTKNLSQCIRNNQFRCVAEGHFSDFMSDNMYYICVKNNVSSFIRFKLQCQSGYHLNKTSIRCVLNKKSEQLISASKNDSSKNNSDQSGSSSKLEEKDKPKKFKCKKEGVFADISDCQRYFECRKTDTNVYRQKRKKCDSEEIFHKDKKKCVEAESYECN